MRTSNRQLLNQEEAMSVEMEQQSIVAEVQQAQEVQSPAATRRPSALQRGMTLIEIMVVMVILGMIAGAVAVNVVGNLKDARIRQAQNDVRTVSDCVDLYKIDKGRYPSSEEGLQALVTSGKCKASMKDPWGHDYVYLSPGQQHSDSYDVKSYGGDGAPGGDGENADIVNP
jgi:general secretion pathway protein G